ncbi:MBL fold metallo-hydrolase [Pseudoneobacillus sp. C159]
MKVISNGVAILELNIQGFVLNPTLIWDEEMAILVDTGMPGQGEKIHLATEDAGVPFNRLKAVILTHQDIDHIGSLPEILHLSQNGITLYGHKLDKPYIEGEFHLLKTDPAKMSKEHWDALPPQMQYLYSNPPKSKVDYTLEDGEVLPFCGGIQVIFTPGHTPGHISLYLRESKTLIAGDAMVAKEGTLMGPIPQTTLDLELATRSLEKLTDLDIDNVICYHGGLCNQNVKEQLAGLVEKVK